MKSDYGNQWEKMSSLEQMAAIASFLNNFIPLNKSIILL